MKKKTLIIGMLTILTVVCTACTSENPDMSRQSGIIIDEPEAGEEWNLQEDDGYQQKEPDIPPSVDYVDASYTKSENLLSMQDTVLMDGISYKMLSCKITKQFGERNRETLADYLEDIDADANLTGSESYVFITLCITNETDSPMEICRIPGNVMGIESDLEVLQLSDSVYIDEYWREGDAQSVNFYMLNPGESITSESGYIINDNDMEGRTLYYEIPHTDDMADPGNKFIKLEESK